MAGFGSLRWRGGGFRFAVVLGFTVVLLGGSVGAPSPAQGAYRASLTDATLPSGAPTLVIDPARWWLAVGNSTALSAAWIGGPAGCQVAPAWFLWTEAEDPAFGSLASSSGASVNFTAVANQSGTEAVSVRSAGALECGSSSTALVGSASANVTVVAPLELSNLSVGPGPARPGAVVNLTGSVVGGVPPYTAEIAWADGSRSTVAFDDPGPFSVSHGYPGGRFLPEISLQDALGSSTSASAPEAIDVSDQAASDIGTAVVGAEVDTPAQFSVLFATAPEGDPPFALCDGLAPSWVDPGGPFENFSCTFTSPGSAWILAGLGSPNLPIAPSELLLPVSPALSISVDPPLVSGEIGQVSELGVGISGGVPPFQVSAEPIGAPGPVVANAAADGTLLLPIEDDTPGALPFVVRVTDALGVEAAVSTSITVEPRLALDASFGRSLSSDASSVAVNASVTGGIPPFYWCLDLPGPISSGALFAGVAGAGEPFGWSGSVDPERSTPVALEVYDSAGATGNATSSSLAFAPFSGGLNASSGPSGDLEVTAELAGGVPPFTLYANVSGRGAWTTSEPADGTFRWTVPVGGDGLVDLSLVAVDRFGYSFTINTSVVLEGGGGSPPTSPIGGVVVGSVAVALVALGVVVWRRHRRGRLAAPPPPDPEEVVRRILEPADGADRPTVELLAEEAGVPLTSVRASIDRLIHEGKIRSETTSEGEEVLAWSHAPST